MTTQTYPIPAHTTHYQQEIKRSQFLTQLTATDSPQAARLWIQSIKKAYPDARHVCWAYIAGAPNTSLKSMSDDGEPSGTAGKPMLNVLEHSGVGDIVVTVVRYFGGIKLGTGGLVRAYSSSVSEAMKQTQFIDKVAWQILRLRFSYAHEAQVRYLLGTVEGMILSVDYTNAVNMSCQIPLFTVDKFTPRLTLLGVNVSAIK